MKNCITSLDVAITDSELSLIASVFHCSRFIYGPTVTVPESPSLDVTVTAHGHPVNE